MNTILDEGGRNVAEPNMETVIVPCKEKKTESEQASDNVVFGYRSHEKSSVTFIL
jgi:hypothetical protein